MWISLSWLRELTDLGDRSPEQIAEDLTMRTALIEAIERRGELPETVVVGRVLERAPHPDADRLSLCQVDVGEGDPVQIVCGAANVAAGQRVAVARPGTELPGGLSIRASKIRGQASAGMICSEVELGVGDDESGILVLDDDVAPGTPFSTLPGVADVCLDIDNKSITHRPDLWGHVGFARELSAIHGGELRIPPIDESLRPGVGPLEVEIRAPARCGRYHALFATGPLGGPSPAWLRRRLIHCGLRPLSLAVDVSNYVMLELGQPTHPFDRRHVRGGRVVVREATPGERLVTLDGEDREMPPGACMIADAERAIAVAGIVGGEESGIAADTTDLVLESAWFEPIAVRRTSTALGLRTDALARFEKHLDPGLSERAIRRYATLLRAIEPRVDVAAEYVVAGDRTSQAAVVDLRPARARMKLGVELTDAAMQQTLERLGFAVTAAGDALRVLVPPHRATRDVRGEDDLIEEVGRIHGYDRIPAASPRFLCEPIDLEPENRAARRAIGRLSSRLGFAEVLSYPYMEDAVEQRAGGGDGAAHVRLRNPLQQSAARLRRTLVPWLLEFVDRNIRTVEDVRLFETGRVFLPREDGALPDQPLMLAAARAERVTRKGGAGIVLRRLKGAVEELAEGVRRALEFRQWSGEPPRWAHPARCAAVFCGGARVGVLAQVHPQVAYDFGWKGEAAAFEVDLTAIAASPEADRAYRAPSRFPPTTVDISFVAPFGLAYAAIRDGLESCVDLLSDVELVDEYTSDPIPKGWRSLTLRLSLQSTERTLTDDDIQPAIASARSWLAERGASLRGGQGHEGKGHEG